MSFKIEKLNLCLYYCTSVKISVIEKSKEDKKTIIHIDEKQ